MSPIKIRAKNKNIKKAKIVQNVDFQVWITKSNDCLIWYWLRWIRKVYDTTVFWAKNTKDELHEFTWIWNNFSPV